MLTRTHGGENRARILRALVERPRNADRLAEELDRHYETVRHHLDVLVDDSIFENSGEERGATYLPTGEARHCWELIEGIIESVE